MNQKIEGTPPPAIRSTTALGGRASGTGGTVDARPVAASAGGDSLRLTGEAASLQVMQRELSSASAVDTARVDAIRASLQAGTYQVNAEAIADGMLGLERQLGA